MVNSAKMLFLLFCVAIKVFGQDDFFEPKSTIGGYGELHYNKIIPEKGKTMNTLDFHRFVLFYSHSWTEKLSLKAEVELEHNYVSGNNGELELEQAYIDYHHADWFGIQAGVILPSVGILNEFHEPPTFLSVERPEYHNKIIPTTWFGNGFAIYGSYLDLDYKLSIVEGLNADKINVKSAIRDARQKGYKSNADHLLYNFRLNYLGIPGQLVGVSVTFNKAFSKTKPIDVSIIDIHYKYQQDGIYIVFESARIDYKNSNLKSSTGYYADLGYNVFRFTSFESELIPFIRFSKFNTANDVDGGGDIKKQFLTNQIMVGLKFKPIPEISLGVDYAQNKVRLNNQKTNYLNIGVGYMF